MTNEEHRLKCRVITLEATLRELRDAVDAAEFDELVEDEDGRMDRALERASKALGPSEAKGAYAVDEEPTAAQGQ